MTSDLPDLRTGPHETYQSCVKQQLIGLSPCFPWFKLFAFASQRLAFLRVLRGFVVNLSL